jgi:hypothetical protein
MPFVLFAVPIRSVEAVLGGSAELPCDILPDEAHDDVYLVLWFKDEATKPMYRSDDKHYALCECRFKEQRKGKASAECKMTGPEFSKSILGQKISRMQNSVGIRSNARKPYQTIPNQEVRNNI